MKKLLFLLPLIAIFSLHDPAPAFCKGEKQACYHTCTSCRTRCKGDKACEKTCYEIKRSCCGSNGYGPGPHGDCTCT